MGSIQKVKACSVETESDLKKAPETISVSESQQKSSTDKFSSLTEELSSIRVKRVNLTLELEKMMALVQRTKDDVKMSFSKVSTKAQKTYVDMLQAVELKI